VFLNALLWGCFLDEALIGVTAWSYFTLLYVILYYFIFFLSPRLHTTANAQGSLAPLAGQGKHKQLKLLGAVLHPRLWRAAPQHGPGHGASTAPATGLPS